jgi:hypothetical protein
MLKLPTYLYLLVSTLIIASTTASSSELIDRYIEVNGGCSFFDKSLVREFNRHDHLPFGKSHIDWTPDDYQRLRAWSVKCLDTWSRVPYRRDLILGELNRRLSFYEQRQQSLIEQIRRQKAADELARQRSEEILIEQIRRQKVADELARQRSEEIYNLRSKVETQVAHLTNSVSSAILHVNSFTSKSRDVDFDKLEAMIQEGLAVEAIIKQVEAEVTEVNSDIIRLKSLGVATDFPRFDRNAFLAFKYRLTGLRERSKVRNACSAEMKKTGIPIELMQTRIYTMSQDDPFLFEHLCGPIMRGANVSYRGPSWSSDSYEIRINRLTLTFVQRTFDQNGPVISKEDQQLTSNTRLILKRISSGRDSQEVNELWQSVNLFNIVVALVSTMGPSLDDR